MEKGKSILLHPELLESESFKTCGKTKGGLKESLKELKNMEKKLRAKCSHRKNSGKLSIKPLPNENTLVKCTRCDEIFSMELVNKEKLNSAIELITQVVNQVQCLETIDNNFWKLKTKLEDLSEQYEKLNKPV